MADHYCVHGERFACADFDPHLVLPTTGNTDRKQFVCDVCLFRLSYVDQCKPCPRNFYCSHEGSYLLPNVVECSENEHTLD